MKYLMFFLLLSAQVFPQYLLLFDGDREYLFRENLIVYWTLDQKDLVNATTVKDNSGNGRTGTISGTVSYSGLRTLLDDGEYVYRNDACGLTAYPYTISVWVKHASGQGDAACVALAVSSSGTLYSALSIISNNAVLNTRQASNDILTDGNVQNNLDYHIVGVWNSNTERIIYINGVAIDTATSSQTFSAYNRFSVGAILDVTPSAIAPNEVWNVSVYDKGLSPAEVLQLYNYEIKYK